MKGIILGLIFLASISSVFADEVLIRHDVSCAIYCQTKDFDSAGNIRGSGRETKPSIFFDLIGKSRSEAIEEIDSRGSESCEAKILPIRDLNRGLTKVGSILKSDCVWYKH